jgi:hypothetical protein
MAVPGTCPGDYQRFHCLQAGAMCEARRRIDSRRLSIHRRSTMSLQTFRMTSERPLRSAAALEGEQATPAFHRDRRRTRYLLG